MNNDFLSDLDPLSPTQQKGKLQQSDQQQQPQQHKGLSLSPEEAAVYARYFSIADAGRTGVISAENAVAFLSKSRLPQSVLGEIWVLSDTEQQGVLSQTSFYTCLKLIALSQSGKPVSLQYLSTKTPLPTFEGISSASSTANLAPKPLVPQATGSSISPTPSSSGGFQLPEPERNRFLAAFNSCSPVSGFVTGSSARDLFLKSGLSNEALARIWNLVDPQSTSQLNLAQFMLAMLIITQMKSGALAAVPPSIPPALMSGIIAAAATAIPGSVTISPSSVGVPASARNPSFQGNSIATPPTFDKRRTTALRSTATPTSFGSNTGSFGSAEPWAISVEDKSLSDSHFESLDVGKKGYLTGEDCFQFFLKSQLDNSVLAQIWDLANISKSTTGLSKDEFSVSMYLIKLAMTGQSLPDILPSNVIPPSLRKAPNPNPAIAPMPLRTSVPAPTKTSSAAEDLMGLGEISFGNPAPADPRRTSIFPGSILQNRSLNQSLSSLNPDDRTADIANARSQVIDLQNKRDLLLPAQQELRAQRAQHEIEFQKVMLEKQELTLALTTASAQYEAESAIYAENAAILAQEQAALEGMRAQVERARQVVAEREEEKRQVIAAIELVKGEIAQSQLHAETLEAQAAALRDEIGVIRPQFMEVHAELQKQKNLVEINKQLLAGVTDEYNTLKSELARESAELETERARANQLATQAAVQGGINERERIKLQSTSQSLNDVRSAPSSPIVSDPFEVPVLQQDTSALVDLIKPITTRAKPPPPPSSSSSHYISALERRRSQRASVTVAPVTAFEHVVPAIPTGPPPPLPPSFTKPKSSSGISSSPPPASPPANSPVAPSPKAATNDFTFDTDFGSAFSAPSSPTKNSSVINDAFSLPLSNDSQKAFDDVFAAFPASTATADTSFADAFAVPEPVSTPARSAIAVAFALPLPPSATTSASLEGFDKFKHRPLANALGDSSSIRSSGTGTAARRRMTKLMSFDAEAEFENAFGTAAENGASSLETTVAMAPVDKAKVDEVFAEVAAAAVSTNIAQEFNFDSAFAGEPAIVAQDVTVAVDSVAIPAAVDDFFGSTVATTSVFDAFNTEFDLASATNVTAVISGTPFTDAFASVPTVTTIAAGNSTVEATPVLQTNGETATAVNLAVESNLAEKVATEETSEVIKNTPGDAKEEDLSDEVKELRGMGFTKEQSISALEKNGFDVTKALKELLPE
ncbi:hypothetical protein HK100_008208 [Physocladia obscura]|uniref:EH domain-containing and endocytosis protein 1 n=1 Tax=Physocladia obscura TaxID=109957 RepID=A0AAD5XJS7_9FUNG|nr:hypothetical protein HK100_008208 [Physocladia obscura]